MNTDETKLIVLAIAEMFKLEVSNFFKIIDEKIVLKLKNGRLITIETKKIA